MIKPKHSSLLTCPNQQSLNSLKACAQLTVSILIQCTGDRCRCRCQLKALISTLIETPRHAEHENGHGLEKRSSRWPDHACKGKKPNLHTLNEMVYGVNQTSQPCH